MTGSELQKRVMIVDDSEDFCMLLVEALKKFYASQYTFDSGKALSLIKQFRPDVVILDYKMPGIMGPELCQQIRGNSGSKHVPVLFVSGENGIDEKLKAFEMGADDYITKPFDIRELLVRIKKLIERDSDVQTEISASNLVMNLYTRRVYIDKEEVQLTPKQFDILKLLVVNQNNLVSRETFLNEIWGDSNITARNVDSQLNYIKKKIEKFDGRISAVPGLGYKLGVSETVSGN